VARNRIRRRIRAIAFSAEFMLDSGFDVLVVGNLKAIEAPFLLLRKELEQLTSSSR
jgi:ribonuclease P protein component